MKTLRVGIASYDEMKSRTLKIARGEIKTHADDPKVWFTSTESFAKVLSEKNRALLTEIARHPPVSLTELANKMGRQKSNLSRTLKTMERYGFVTLRKGARGRIVPEVPYKNIVLTVPLDPHKAKSQAA
jgi:predicted transcriptional regulator